jgi:hypothetical protein
MLSLGITDVEESQIWNGFGTRHDGRLFLFGHFAHLIVDLLLKFGQ